MEEKEEYEIVEEEIVVKKTAKFENSLTTALGIFLFLAVLCIAFKPQPIIEKNSTLIQYKMVSRFTEMLTPKLIKFEADDDIENLTFKKNPTLMEFADANTRKQIAEQTLVMWDEIVKDNNNNDTKRNAYVNMAVINWLYKDKTKAKEEFNLAKQQTKTTDNIDNQLIDKISSALFSDKDARYIVIKDDKKANVPIISGNKENIAAIGHNVIEFTSQEIIDIEPLPISAIVLQKLDPQIEQETTFNITAKKTTSYIYTSVFLGMGGLFILIIFITSGILWILSAVGSVKITTPIAVETIEEETSEIANDKENQDEYPHSPHRFGIGISLFIILVYLIAEGLLIELFNRYGSYLTTDPERLTSITVLYSIVFSAIFILIVLWYATKSSILISTFFKPAKRPILQAFSGYAMVIPLVTLISLIQASSNNGQNDTQQVMDMVMNNSSDNISRILFGVAIVVLAPIIEETLFRGFLFHALMRRMPWGIAAIISAICFGLIHGQLSTILPITVLGLMLAILTYRNRSIIPAIWAHAIFNGMQLLSVYGILDVLK
ncbi:MAG: type II CAAX endopeptidase family protein [bacterium]